MWNLCGVLHHLVKSTDMKHSVFFSHPLPQWVSFFKTLAASPLKWLMADGRHFQILYLGSFLLFGVFNLGWEVEALNFLLVVGSCLLVQLLFAWYHGLSLTTLKSAMISSLGLCILLKVNHPSTAVLAAAVAIGSKFLIQVEKKHVFNPVNIAIVLTTLFTQDAWVSPGQWGSDVALLFFVGAAGLMVLLKVGRLDISLWFIVTFFGLEMIRSLFYLGWPADHFMHFMTNGTVLLFTFFMITDPVTTPNHPMARILFSVAVGALAFVFTHVLYMQSGAPIWALFVVSPSTLFLDRLFAYKRFSWQTHPAR